MPARYAVARILTTTMGELHTPKCGVGIHAQIADKYGGVEQMNFDAESKYWWLRGTGVMSDFVTHWIPMPQLPRKKE